MIIKTKRESINKIKELNLNHFAEEIFCIDEHDKIKEFMQNNPAKEYCLRDPINTNGLFFFVENIEQCILMLKNYQNFVTVCVSSNEFDEDIILLGDIKVKKSFDDDVVDITARTDSKADHRNIYENPTYNLHTNIQDDKLWQIPGFSKLINYITTHNLFDIVVEFVVYDCPVGLKNEYVAIYELRSEY